MVRVPIVRQLLQSPREIKKRHKITPFHGISWRPILLARVVLVISLFSIAGLSGLGCPGKPSPPATPKPAVTTTPSDRITRYSGGVKVEGKPLTGSTPINLGTQRTVSTESTGSADIEFVSMRVTTAMCALYTNSELISRPPAPPNPPQTLFQQKNGSAYVTWAGKNTVLKGEPVATDGIFIDPIDPAIRIIVVRDREREVEARVAVYRGDVNVTVVGVEKPIRVSERQELKAEPPSRKYSIDPAKFTPAEEEIFQRTAKGLSTETPPASPSTSPARTTATPTARTTITPAPTSPTPPAPVPIYKWAVPTDLAPFRDVRLQQAICYILDEGDIVKKAFPAKNVRFEAEQEWSSGINDLAKAKQLMAEAGYPNGFKLEILAAPSTDEGIAALLAAIVNSLSGAGISPGRSLYANVPALPHIAFSLIVKRVQ